MTATIFRSLLIASIASGFLGGLIDLLIPSAVPEILSNAVAIYDQTTNTVISIFGGVLAIVLLIVWIVAIVGLYQFRSWSPRLFLIFTVVTVPTSIVIGPTVSSGWTSALSNISSTLSGAILALVYFSALKDRFVGGWNLANIGEGRPQLTPVGTSDLPLIATKNLHSDKAQTAIPHLGKPLARIGQRFTSQYIDSAAALAVAAVFYCLANAIGLSNEWLFVGFFLYLLICDGLPGGQSLGKRFTKISVVHVDTEKPCTYWQSCVRNLTMIVGIVDAAFISGKQRRRLGDHLARTKVIQFEVHK